LKINRTEKIVITILSVLLVISLGILLFLHIYSPSKKTHTEVSGNVINPEPESSSGSSSDIGGTSRSEADTSRPTINLSLYWSHSVYNVPFRVVNMLPGDSETRYYSVKVSYKGDVSVEFKPKIRPGYETLAEVLRCNITLQNSGEVLYDGLMSNVPESIKQSLSSDIQTVDVLVYEVSVYLDDSVDNRYQNKELVADFEWWVPDTQKLGPPPTGDNARPVMYMAFMFASAFVLTIFLIRRKRYEK